LNKVVVLGALGLVGRAVIGALEDRRDWEVIGVSRRAPDFSSRARFLQLDLTDRDACRQVFAAPELNDVSHVVYAALFEKPDLIAGWQDAEQIETNLSMLRNVLDFLGSSLRHVTLLQGTKAYGAHIKPMTNPGRESDPRHEGPNFYWAQEDYVRDLAASKDWAFSIMRWQTSWPTIAQVFGMEVGAPVPMRLAEVMPGCEAIWAALVARYDLRPLSLEQLVGSSWQFADAVFGYGGSPPDTIVSTVKARRFGFHDCCDTNEMFERQLRHMQAQRLLPPLTRGVGW